MSGRWARGLGVSVVGARGEPVDIEVYIGGMPGVTMVGLPDSAVLEARERIRAATLCSGLVWPQERITINLAPASVPKQGTQFDLAVALTVQAAMGVVPATALRGLVMLGELGLDGRVNGYAGSFACAVAVRRLGYAACVPVGDVDAAAGIPGLQVFGVATLRQAVEMLSLPRDRWRTVQAVTASAPDGGGRVDASAVGGVPDDGQPPPDMGEVVGQGAAVRAATVAAAGGHHILFEGAPGLGKSMIAGRLPGLLPDLSDEQALEVAAVRSITPAGGSLEVDPTTGRFRPPIAAPHHTASAAAVLGGGTRGRIVVGAVTRAHHGVLLLDEAPEFTRPVLDGLRQPLESAAIVVSRAGQEVRLPAAFQLVLTANPCPCGRWGLRTAVCTCTPDQVRRYRNRLSGPIRDRVDVWCRVTPAGRGGATSAATPSTSTLRAAVCSARARARHRWSAAGLAPTIDCNARVPDRMLHDHVTGAFWPQFEDEIQRGAISRRGAAKILRLARTLADLADRAEVGTDDIDEARVLRLGEDR